MAALSSERTDLKEQDGRNHRYPVAADAVIYQGAIVAIDSGYLVAASTATGLAVVGIASQSVDNTGGANGALWCEVKRGVFTMKNSAAADEITLSEIGSACYVVDDQTVAKTDGGATRSAAGVVHDLIGTDLYVRFE